MLEYIRIKVTNSSTYLIHIEKEKYIMEEIICTGAYTKL